MNATQTAKLAAITGYCSRYEVVLIREDRTNDDRVFLLGYTPRRTRVGLLHVAQNRGSAVVAATQMTDEAVMTFDEWKTLGFDLGNGWRIRFTGRTQREAIIEGEREFIGQVRS